MIRNQDSSGFGAKKRPFSLELLKDDDYGEKKSRKLIGSGPTGIATIVFHLPWQG